MQRLIDKIEAYGFQCDGGPLTGCQEWQLLKAELGLEGLLPTTPVDVQVTITTEPADEMLPEAIKIVMEAGTASICMIQRRLHTGYNRAARILEAMEKAGIITAPGEFGKRDVIGVEKKTCNCQSC